MKNKKGKTILVVLGVDSHLSRIKKCISTIKLVYKSNVDVGVATFGNESLEPSVEIKKFCDQEDLLFFDSERQKFLNLSHNLGRVHGFIGTDREFHVCEIIGNISISKYFYDLGYDEVYLLHNDLFVVRDFLPVYRKHMIGHWGFVVPHICAKHKNKLSIKELEKIDPLVRGDMMHNGSLKSRFTQTVVIFNKSLINSLYDNFTNNENMYTNFFEKFSYYGDIALVQLFDNFYGFRGETIEENILIDKFHCHDTSAEAVKTNEKITHIHGDELWNSFENIIEELITDINGP